MNAPIKVPSELEAEKAILGGIFMDQDVLIFSIDTFFIPDIKKLLINKRIIIITFLIKKTH